MSFVVMLVLPCVSSSQQNDVEILPKLLVATSLDEKWLALDDFQIETGIKANFYKLPRNSFPEYSVIDTIYKYAAQNHVEVVWLTTDIEKLVDLKQRGLLTTFSNQRFNAEKDWYDADRNFVGIYGDILVFGFNEFALKRYGSVFPKKWDDLLSDRYRKQIVLPAPSSHTGGVLLYYWYVRVGEQKWMRYLKELDKNVRYYNRYDFSCSKQLSRGDLPICLGFLSDLMSPDAEDVSQNRSLKPRFLLPEDGTVMQIVWAGIFNNGGSTANSEVLVNWLLSERFQRKVAASGQYSANPSFRSVGPVVPNTTDVLLLKKVQHQGEDELERNVISKEHYFAY
jgi:iron(III) transport system substrate-binding protein